MDGPKEENSVSYDTKNEGFPQETNGWVMKIRWKGKRASVFCGSHEGRLAHDGNQTEGGF